MGHFDNSSKPKRLPEIPARLARLNRELTTNEKAFDYVWAVRNECRIRVCVARIRQVNKGDCEFVATCSIGGKVHRAFGYLPSMAFVNLTDSIRWILARLSYERNMSKIIETATV